MPEAVAPGDPISVWTIFLDDVHTLPFLTADEFESLNHASSAQLIAFLTRLYGIETVREAYLATQGADTSEEIEAAVTGVFGDGFYDALDDIETNDLQCPLPTWRCEESVLEVRTVPLTVEGSTDCVDDPALLGAVSEEGEGWYPYQQFILDLPEAQTLIVDVGDNAIVEFEPCGYSSCDEVGDFDLITFHPESHGTPPVFESDRPAGRYTIIVRPLDPTAPFRATID